MGQTLTMHKVLGQTAVVAAATVLAILSAMLHGSHIGARLQGPRGWTGWATLDVVLVAVPFVAPIAAFLLMLLSHRGVREAGTRAGQVYLLVAMFNCGLAVFWI